MGQCKGVGMAEEGWAGVRDCNWSRQQEWESRCLDFGRYERAKRVKVLCSRTAGSLRRRRQVGKGSTRVGQQTGVGVAGADVKLMRCVGRYVDWLSRSQYGVAVGPRAMRKQNRWERPEEMGRADPLRRRQINRYARRLARGSEDSRWSRDCVLEHQNFRLGVSGGLAARAYGRLLKQSLC